MDKKVTADRIVYVKNKTKTRRASITISYINNLSFIQLTGIKEIWEN